MSKLGQLLVARGWIGLQQLTRALKNQHVVGGRLGTCLLEMDALGEDLLGKGLSEQLGLPAARVEDLRGIPDEVRDLLPGKVARRCRAVPFQLVGGRLDVALLDPRNLACQDEVAFASGRRVRIHVIPEIRIYEALEKYYDEECPSRFVLLIDRLNRTRYLWDAPGGAAPAEAEPASAFPRLHELSAPPPLPEPPMLQTPPALPRTRPAAPRLAAPASISPAAPAAAARAATAAAPAPKLRTVPLSNEERAALGIALPQEPPPPPRIEPRSEPKIEIKAEPPRIEPRPEPKPEPRPQPLPPLQIQTPPPPPPAAPATIEALEAAFAAAADPEEVATLLLAHLALGFRRVVLFQVSRDRVTGWKAAGREIDPAELGRYAIGFDQPSLFLNLRQSSGLFLGPLPPMPAHREMARLWGGEMPRQCAMLPVRIKERLVLVIYLDNGEHPLGGVPQQGLEPLQRIAAATASAFERCILQRKQGAKS